MAESTVSAERRNTENADKRYAAGWSYLSFTCESVLHYAFDMWMKKYFSDICFERYADDVIVHCRTQKQAKYVRDVIPRRMRQCGHELHPKKTHIVYCQDEWRSERYEKIQFDFLGYTFRPRTCKRKDGTVYINFLPAVSRSSLKSIREKMRSWKLRQWTNRDIQYISKYFNAKLRGWLNYYGKYYLSALYPVFRTFDCILRKWAMNKYKKFRKGLKNYNRWIMRVALSNPTLFVHWELELTPKV